MQFQHLGGGDERIGSKRKKTKTALHITSRFSGSHPNAAAWSLVSVGMLQKLWDAMISFYLAGYKFTIR